MEDIKQMMQQHYIKYASYVILDRAIPNIIDGLKPVQRRILYLLWLMNDGKLHKVANVAGQTMALHPHGDAPITEALINIANKGYLLDTQGNFGNLLTGDAPAASRYIETRLSQLAKETLFNADLTEMISSYDGRTLEPITLPSKLPLILLQGVDGIAVGMATHIFPHNFVELLQAEIDLLEGKAIEIFPDFPTGGFMDASEYNKGLGKVKLRANIEIKDSKTLVIKEICYSTTTESLVKSIEEAAKRGKIKIDGIHDYTAENIEIEIKLPRGQYAKEILDALYAYTECEVTLNSQIVVIKDNLPWEPTVDEILSFHVDKLQQYLKKELEIESSRLKEKIFERSLEQIFIENRLYKPLEELDSNEAIHQSVANGLLPFHHELYREPIHQDRERLLNIPIRRISRFDVKKNQEEIQGYRKQLSEIEKELKSIKKVTIRFLQGLIKKYGPSYPRKTKNQAIEQVDMRAMETRAVKIGFDPVSGFIGTKVLSDSILECTNFDKLLLFYKDGTYTVINIPEKQYIQRDGKKIAFVAIADKKTIINIAYRDLNTHFAYAKRFIVDKFLIDKTYRYMDEGLMLDYISTQPSQLELQLIPKPRQKVSKVQFNFENISIKGVGAGGIRMSRHEVKKIITRLPP